MLPSGNPRRATVYSTIAPTQPGPAPSGIDPSLWDKLFEGRAMSLDITKPGMGINALRMSATDIPTADYLQASLSRRWNNKSHRKCAYKWWSN